MEKSAWIAGASGLVGQELLRLLLEDSRYSAVCALVRRPLGISHPKLQEIVCDWDRLKETADVPAADDVFCCLGTTIKKARTREAMYKVDVDYPLALARLALTMGACHYLLVSAVGANPRSRIPYSRMKGELEEQIKRMPYEAASIFRPSLLLGDRAEFRLGERIAVKVSRAFSKLTRSPLPASLALEARTVASAMLEAAQRRNGGVNIYDPRGIKEIVKL
jgi:Predicted nucleoside-diphosphate-sugar epimerases